MFRFLKNKKGIVPVGILFSGGVGSAIGSTFLIVAVLAAGYTTQNDYVVRKFREKKAVQEFGISESVAKSMSDADLLDTIRDDAPGAPTGRGDDAFTAVGMRPRLGG